MPLAGVKVIGDYVGNHELGLPSELGLLCLFGLFAYTVGLRQTFGHPELILVGEWSSAHPILNGVGGLVREGARFAPGDSSDDVLEGYPARFGAVLRAGAAV